LLGLGGQSPLDRGCPGVEGGGVEGIGEEVRAVSCHRGIKTGRRLSEVCGPSARDRSCSPFGKANTRSFPV
jgi:hypothetical protein